MGLWNLGSIGDQVYNSVDNIPTTISGLLPAISYAAVQKVQNYTGQTVGSVGIAEKYQPALTYFAMADALMRMSTQGADVSSISLGDFSVSKGASSNIVSAAESYEKRAKDELKVLGFGTRWGRTYA